MPNISITVKNKVARADRVIIVCDNSDYTAVFDFDDEWSAYETKTARFVYGGTYTDVVFTGNSCPIPEIHDTRSLTIGVYAGDLHTTTPAYVSCVPSILCGNGIPADPTPDVYAQIMELLNKESGIWYPAVDDAGNVSWTRSMSETEPQPVNIKGPKGDAGANGADGNDGISPAVSVAAITGGNRVTITDAEGAKTFDVMDGAQGASGADGKDYVLTDTDKQEIAKTAAGLVDVPSVQPDWNQNDSTQPDYVKNRPFYAGNLVETVMLPETTITITAGSQNLISSSFPYSFELGKTYVITFDGVDTEYTAYEAEGFVVIGYDYSSVVGGSGYVVMNGNGAIALATLDTSLDGSHTIAIKGYTQEIIKIDEKYLPDNLATKSDVEAAQTTASNAQTTAENAQTTADNAQTAALDLAARMFGHTSVVDNAFKYDKTLSITSLPACITSIGSYAFSGCTNLALTSLPSGLTSIKGGAFSGCTQLALTSLPDGLTEIVGSAFYGCGQLALTSLPDGLTEIDSYTFYYCTNLALTSLPSGLTIIRGNAFSGCSNLTSITFTGKPSAIADTAFESCSNLTTINVPWAEGEIANAPWGATSATINYNYTEVS